MTDITTLHYLVVAAALFVLGVIPGMPWMVFLLLAAIYLSLAVAHDH